MGEQTHRRAWYRDERGTAVVYAVWEKPPPIRYRHEEREVEVPEIEWWQPKDGLWNRMMRKFKGEE